MPADNERKRELVRIEHPRGGTLVGDLSTAGDTSHVVLFLHGFGSVRNGEKAAALEAACARWGWNFAAFDLRGHGDSSGTMLDLRPRGIVEDLRVIETFLASRGLHTLLPMGSSMGGWTAAWWARLCPGRIPACVLLAPAWHFPHGLWQRLTADQQQHWRSTGKHRLVTDWFEDDIGIDLLADNDAFPLEQLLAGWDRPALIFHGLRDEIVPCSLTWDVLHRLPPGPVETRIFNQGDHRLVEYKDEMAEEACRFFARHLVGPAVAMPPG